MAAALIVPVIGAAAKAYAEQLAATLGAGIVETLFSQNRIAGDLDAIKKQLEVLNAFIRIELPALIGQTLEFELSKVKESEIVEKSKTIDGKILSLVDARTAGLSATAVDLILEELVGHADAIFEMGGFLLSKGQQYYASVGVAFCAGLQAYAAILKESPVRTRELKMRMQGWKVRLLPWVDSAITTSLTGYRDRLNTREELSNRVVPTIQSWIVGHERRFAISWVDSPGFGGIGFGAPPSVVVYGAWYALFQGAPPNGDELGQVLPPGVTFDQAVANGMLTFTIPEWWTVKANVPASRADYEECLGRLYSLVDDQERYPARIAVVNNAINLTNSALAQIDKILNASADVDTTLRPEQFIVTGAPFVSLMRQA